MPDDLKTDVDMLEKVSKCWRMEAVPGLRDAAVSIDPLKFTEVQFGPLFNSAWESYIAAAEYVQRILNQAAPAAEQMANGLHLAAVSFDAQESQNQQALNNAAGDAGF